MSRIRRTGAVALVLALWGTIVTQGAVASEPEAQGPLTQGDFVVVTGTGEYTRGRVSFSGTETMSDPRVSGASEVTNNWRTSPLTTRAGTGEVHHHQR